MRRKEERRKMEKVHPAKIAVITFFRSYHTYIHVWPIQYWRETLLWHLNIRELGEKVGHGWEGGREMTNDDEVDE